MNMEISKPQLVWSTVPATQLLSLHAIVVVVGLLVYVLTTHSLRQRRSPPAAISWVLTIALLPYLGLPLYLLFGSRKRRQIGHQFDAVTHAAKHDAPDDWNAALLAAMAQPAAQPYHDLRIHRDGNEALAVLWELIAGARHEIDLCTFIVGADAMGATLIERLAERARNGVRVRLLLDDAGHKMAGGIHLRALRQAGGEVASFSPILRLFSRGGANLRNHRKMLIVDGARLWSGGRNFATEYFAGDGETAPWQDLTFDLQGPVVAQAHALFAHDWAFATGAAPPQPVSTPVTPAAPGQLLAQVIASGPDQVDDTVHDLLVTACFKARHRIMAVTPYFVPSDMLLKALTLAARRGVRVDLVLPARSNHHLADIARNRALRDLADAGAAIWLTPYMLHAKAVVIDDNLALAGSLNLDARSLFLNYEMMIAFHAPADVDRFAGFIARHRHNAARHQPAVPGLVRDLARGLLLWLAFQL